MSRESDFDAVNFGRRAAQLLARRYTNVFDHAQYEKKRMSAINGLENLRSLFKTYGLTKDKRITYTILNTCSTSNADIRAAMGHTTCLMFKCFGNIYVVKATPSTKDTYIKEYGILKVYQKFWIVLKNMAEAAGVTTQTFIEEALQTVAVSHRDAMIENKINYQVIVDPNGEYPVHRMDFQG